MGVFHQMVNAYWIFQRKYEQHCLWKYIGGLYSRVEEN